MCLTKTQAKFKSWFDANDSTNQSEMDFYSAMIGFEAGFEHPDRHSCKGDEKRADPQMSVDELLKIFTQKGGDWYSIAREVELRTIAAMRAVA